MNKHFMIDIETTGISPKAEHLLQIGALELDFVDGFWQPGRAFERVVHSDRQPSTDFARKHMVDLYRRCNDQPMAPAWLVRDELLKFFWSCGTKSPDVYLMGWNATGFDIPFLVEKQVLEPSRYETLEDGSEQRMGDFHYRVYELSGAVAVAENVTGIRRTELLVAATAAYRLDMPDGNAHDALYDCYNQTRILNGLIRLLREGKSS